MCGISCVFFADNKRNSLNELKKINNSISHRGPDDDGIYTSKSSNLTLGMRRLTILDDIGGKQPMISPDGRYVLIFNGEIINSNSLRKYLIDKGCKFESSHSDTEVLLNLLIVKGAACINELNGMFSFILYDSKEEKLLVARDRMGIKPLYKLKEGNNLYFCSEIRGILESYDAPTTLNFQSVFNYLSLMYLPDHNSIYNEIKRQKPGTYTIYDLKSGFSEDHEFFKFKFSKKLSSSSNIQKN